MQVKFILHQKVPKQKSCSSAVMGKRQQRELSAPLGMGELKVLGWYQQSLQLGGSSCSSVSCQLLQLQQCFNASTSTL